MFRLSGIHDKENTPSNNSVLLSIEKVNLLSSSGLCCLASWYIADNCGTGARSELSLFRQCTGDHKTGHSHQCFEYSPRRNRQYLHVWRHNWRRVVYLNMTDSSSECPSGWQLTFLFRRTCGRVSSGHTILCGMGRDVVPAAPVAHSTLLHISYFIK